MPTSFVFDANRCTGCGACRLACTIENGLEPERSWRRIETFNPRRHPAAPLFHLSLACNHCAEPACMYACPAHAYSRDAATGAVILDESKCLGCKYCSWACPYDAPVFDEARGVMTKCTFCEHRLRDGLKPACAALCPTGALDCADLPESEMVNEVDGFPASELGPRIRIRPLATGRRLPVMTAPEPTVPFLAAPQASGSEITLRSEWSLAAFTTLAAALVAAFTGRLLGALSFEPVAFPLAAALAMGLAGLHLGKRTRAYRAVLNLRRSWLSREVVTLSAFFVAGTGALLVWPESAALGWAAAALGFVAMFCGNRVYGVLRGSPGVRGHSASLVGMAAYLAAVCVGEAAFAVAFGIGRAPFYLLRKLRFRSAGRPPRPLVSAVRLGLGFLVPLALWLVAFERLHLVLLACALAGELIDRCEFYAEIEKPSPRRQMAIDLERHLARGRAVGAPLAAAAAD